MLYAMSTNQRLLKKCRRLDTPKAKRQQRCRLRKTLFKKCRQYSMECDADVYTVLRLRGSGHIFIFQSDPAQDFSPSLQDLVCAHLPSETRRLSMF